MWKKFSNNMLMYLFGKNLRNTVWVKLQNFLLNQNYNQALEQKSF